jgi:hypothetical protein
MVVEPIDKRKLVPIVPATSSDNPGYGKDKIAVILERDFDIHISALSKL